MIIKTRKSGAMLPKRFIKRAKAGCSRKEHPNSYYIIMQVAAPVNQNTKQ